MRLICISPYRTQTLNYKVGVVIDVKDEEGEFLLRDSPGSFQRPQDKVRQDAPDEPDTEAEITEAKTAAISAETETGIKAPDRRSRRGRKRGK